jgi:hypothetical protein
MTTEKRVARFAVDRREGAVVVLVRDSGETIDVSAKRLPPECRSEGAVVDVPMDEKGAPRWEQAIRKRDEEARRLRDASDRVAQLRQRDPGGDIQL